MALAKSVTRGMVNDVWSTCTYDITHTDNKSGSGTLRLTRTGDKTNKYTVSMESFGFVVMGDTSANALMDFIKQLMSEATPVG